MKYVGPNNGSGDEGRRRKRDAERERERKAGGEQTRCTLMTQPPVFNTTINRRQPLSHSDAHTHTHTQSHSNSNAFLSLEPKTESLSKKTRSCRHQKKKSNQESQDDAIC